MRNATTPATRRGRRLVRCSAVVALGLASAAVIVGTAGATVAGRSYAVVLTADRGTASNYLNWVSCKATTCMAVGWGQVGPAQHTLVEQRRPHSWAVLKSPSVGTHDNLLASVSCVSTTFCVAVGSHSTGASGEATIIERWNGTAWTLMASPVPPGPDNELLGVACPSVTMCVAVGRGLQVPARTLVEVWHGGAWTIAHTPNLSIDDNFLQGVSCPTTTMCMAVGFSYIGAVAHSLVLAWHGGGGWALVAAPDRGGATGTYPYGVSCPTTMMCRAVGDFRTATVARTFILAWNGHAWTTLPSPNESATSNELSGVDCATTTSCEAVGNFYSGGSRNLVERWTGAGWTVVPTPNAPGGDNYLANVSCTSPVACTASGELTLLPSSVGRTYVLVGH